MERLLVRDSSPAEFLCCVLEQHILLAALVMAQPKNTENCPDMTENC